MTTYSVHSAVAGALASFRAPEEIGFGTTMVPVMYRVDYDLGKWDAGALLPYGPIELDPSARVLQYAYTLFEGLKAYRVQTRSARLFRPERNWQRLNQSAARLMMPDLPEDRFMDGVSAVVAHCESLIPRAPGESLYLRPFMFATQPSLGPTVPNQFCFIVIGCLAQAYHAGNLRIVIERDRTRAVVGGTGNVKVGGNYAAALQANHDAVQRGFDLPLWLDSQQHRYIEELSIMNVFAVVDGALHTPSLSGTILPGVTRDSLMMLARDRGLVVHERRMDIGELLDQIRSGACTEAFACGTAAIIAPIEAIGDGDDEVFELPSAPGPVATALRQALLDLQEGRVADKFDWLRRVDPGHYPHAAGA